MTHEGCRVADAFTGNLLAMMKLHPAFCLVATAILAIDSIYGQAPPPDDLLPGWSRTQWQELAKAKGLEISTRLNPATCQGDFDGDGNQDLAILVRRIDTRKEGIAILLQRRAKTFLLGAGSSFGNGGDDFSWIDSWNIEERDALQSSHHAKRFRLRADRLAVAKEGSASAVIYFRNGRFRWQQQGD